MIDRLCWPLLHHRFQDRAAPAWFHRRVWTHLKTELRPPPLKWHAYICALLPVPLIVLWACGPAVLSILIVPALLWCALCLFLVGFFEWNAWESLHRTARTTYDTSRDHVLDRMTGHERLLYQKHRHSRP